VTVPPHYLLKRVAPTFCYSLFPTFSPIRIENELSIYTDTLCFTLGPQDVPSCQDGRPLSIKHCQLPDFTSGDTTLSVAIESFQTAHDLRDSP
jgi:hypothetical protein